MGYKEEYSSIEDMKYRMGICFEREENVIIGD